MELMFIPVMHIIIFVSTHICLKLKKLSEQGYIPRRCFFRTFVFLSTWLVCWTWPKLYTTTSQEWENRKYKLFDW